MIANRKQATAALKALCLLFTLLGLAPQLNAQRQVTSAIVAASVEASGESIVGPYAFADAGMGLADELIDGIDVEGQITYSKNTSLFLKGYVGEFRVGFQLVTSSGSAVSLRLPSGGTGTVHYLDEAIDGDPDAGFTISILQFGTPRTETFTARLQPNVQLDPQQTYEVRMRSYYWGEIKPGIFGWISEDSEDSAGDQYLHFTGATSGDAALNVISELTAVSWQQRSALATADAAADNSFAVQANYTLYRFDNWLQSRISTAVQVVFDVRLMQVDAVNGDVEIPLAQSQFSDSLGIYNYDSFFTVKVHTEASGNLSMRLRPASGVLDCVNHQYYAEVQISHVEVPSLGTQWEGNLALSSVVRLMHFGGALDFGGIATALTGYSNDPATTASANASYLQASLSSAAGYISGWPDYTWGGATVTVRLFADGTATAVGQSAVLMVNQPVDPDIGTLNGLRYIRSDLELTHSSGLDGQVNLILPAGMGIGADASSMTLANSIDFGITNYGQDLHPTRTVFTYVPPSGGPFFVYEESKPVGYEVSQLDWQVLAGTLQSPSTGLGQYVRADEINQLSAAPVAPELSFKRSNDQYYAMLDSVTSSSVDIVPGPDAAARLRVGMNFAAGSFASHFPYDSKISFAGGNIKVTDDLIDTEISELGGVGIVENRYNLECSSDACPLLGPTYQIMALEPQGQLLRFTPDGGLVAVGAVSTATGGADHLKWGFISGTNSYHHQTTPFAAATFHMPGHFLRGDHNPLNNPVEGAGILLLTGANAKNPLDLERPETHAYKLGLTDYAGLNYRTEADSAFRSTSTICGQKGIEFDLTGRSKYYIRPAGVTGIHEAVPGTFPPELALYGYAFTFDQYGLSYIASDPEESRTSGSIVLKGPSDFTQAFEELMFTCLGALDSAKVPKDGGDQTLAYWEAPITIHTIQFAREDACDSTQPSRFLAGVSAWAAYITEPLYGTLGFMPDGTLMIPSDSPVGEDSRLSMPSRVTFRGPGRLTTSGDPSSVEYEQYELVPVSTAYYNRYALADEQTFGMGFINFAGMLDVAFFDDLMVHVQTKPRNAPENSTLPIDLAGGWTESGQTYWSLAGFDVNNRGRPSGVSSAVYRNKADNSSDSDPYQIHAYYSWLGVLNFDYRLVWSDTTRSFRSDTTEKEDLLVVSVEHQIDYLSADTAEISFGATYEGMPSISLTNFAFNALDEQTGIYESMLQAATQPVVSTIEDGIDSMAQLLNDRMDALLGEFLEDQIATVVSPAYQQLEQLALALNYQTAPINGVLEQHIVKLTNTNSLQSQLQDLASGVGQANYLVSEIDGRLAKIQSGIDALINGIYYDGNGDIIPMPDINATPAVAAFLAKNANDEFQVLTPFVGILLEQLAPDISSELQALLSGAVDDLNSRVNVLLEDAKPTLDQIIFILTDLRGLIHDVRVQLGAGQQFITELEDIIQKANAEIAAVSENIRAQLLTTLDAIPDGSAFLQYTEEEIVEMIAQEIRDQVMATDFIAEIQVTLKQHLYDLDAAIDTAIAQCFAEVNNVVKSLIGDLLNEVDESINGFLGSLDAVLGAGQIDGYALINGDALRKLHLDIYLQMKVPDDLEFRGYLTIEQFDSNSEGSCSPGGAPGSIATEVTVGALDVPADWLSPDLRLNVEGKFSFRTPDFALLGLGGGLWMSSGEVNFESFKVTDFGVQMMFGATENYLAAELGMGFGSYEAYGGVFFGRTCEIDPLLMVDEDVAEVLGAPNPTFTGVYIYGECHIPVSEAVLGIPASCMFRISAGVGAGVFYFTEGNTLGGKIYASASGEALCVVSIKGEVTMVGMVSSGELSYRGKGRLSGKAGPCPFCVKFKKTATLSYKAGSWDVDL